MSIDPYKTNISQKPIIDSQKGLIDKCKNCKDLELEKETVNIFCNLIDPTGKKSINKCIEDLKKILEDYEILLDLYKITIKFIEQQEKGRPKINLDTKYIKYLRDIKKMTFEEIAKKYNVSRNTIRNRYYNN